MFHKENDLQCTICEMQFSDIVRLWRYSKDVHLTRHDGFEQKWYWDN